MINDKIYNAITNTASTRKYYNCETISILKSKIVNDFEYYTSGMPKLMLLQKLSTTVELYFRFDYEF